MADPARLDELRRQFEENPRRYFAPLASALRRAGDATAAVTLARTQLAVYPGHLTGHVILGQALLDIGDVAGARGALERAVALDAGNVVALQELVSIGQATGDAAGVAHWTTRLAEADPELAAEVAPPPAGAFEPLDFEDFEADDAGAFTAGALDPSLAVEEAPRVRADESQAGPDVGGGTDPVPPADPVPPVALADDVHAPLDPVVGLDVPPEDPLPPAMRDALPELVGDADAAPSADDATAAERAEVAAGGRVAPPPAAPFVTETMAGLLLAQGHTAQALDVYERLLEQRPDDGQLQARVAELRDAELRAPELRAAELRDADARTAGPITLPTGAPTAREFFAALAYHEVPDHERPVDSAGPPVEPAPVVTDATAATPAVAAMPTAASPARAELAGPVFDPDERAAHLWRAAFAPLPRAAVDDGAEAPASAAVASGTDADAAVVDATTFDDLSFDQFFSGFGDPAPRDAPPIGDFERWAAAADRPAAPHDVRGDVRGGAPATLHAATSGVPAPEPVPAAVPAASASSDALPVPAATPPPIDDPDDDLAQFNAWLRGLAE